MHCAIRATYALNFLTVQRSSNLKPRTDLHGEDPEEDKEQTAGELATWLEGGDVRAGPSTQEAVRDHPVCHAYCIGWKDR